MDKFLIKLKKFKRRWQKQLLLNLLYRSLGWVSVAIALLCWLDFILSLPGTARIVLSGIAILVLLVLVGGRAVSVLRISEKDCAIHADSILQNRRREILSSLEVGQSKRNFSTVSEYLVGDGIKKACTLLDSLKTIQLVEKDKKIHKQVFFCLVVALLPAVLNLSAARTLISRVFLPYADIPPYSSYEFAVTPKKLEVLYGDDFIVKVSLDGKRVNKSVRFLTRQGDRILESSCFQAGPKEYVQKLERVMQPVEFCFRIGKARSKWHRLSVLFQPHIQSAQVRVVPPDYSKQSEKVFTLGSEELKGLKNSLIELKVQSNRPLKGGQITITPLDKNSHSETLEGTVTGKNEISYKWKMATNGFLDIMLYDILGTPARESLRVKQELVPDEVPTVALSEPAAFSLATPTIKIPVYGTIEDDIGIKRCDMYRTLKGYRSRPKRVGLNGEEGVVEVNNELDLAELGVEPGQVIELFLEASDTNPELTGVSASDIARIKIITEQEYAEMVRNRVTMDAFGERFHTISYKYGELLKMLSDTAKELEKKGITQKKSDELMKSLQAEMKKTAKSLNEIAKDFAAFDVEKKLSDTAEEIVGQINYSLGHMGWEMKENDLRKEAVARSLERLKSKNRNVKSLVEDAEEIASVGRVMAMAAWYKALLDRQRILVRKLDQYGAGERKISSPKILARQQNTIREDLIALLAELEKEANELPEGYERLKGSSLEFVNMLRELDIPPLMSSCEKACRNRQPRKAWSYASKTLEKMEQIFDKKKNCGFAQLCSGGIGFNVPDHLSKTMSQMLKSLIWKYGYGVGWGEGLGAAGVGYAGAWEGSYLNGYSAFNLPVYGPKRNNPFSSAADRSKNNTNGKGINTGVAQKTQFNEVMPFNKDNSAGGSGFFIEQVPPRYRDAVKAFYGEEDN